MVASQHDRTHFAITYHFIELQCDVHTSDGILVKDTGLCANHEVILLGIANPNPVVHILSASFFRDASHRCLVGLHQVFVLATEAYPTERTITIIEQFRSHDVFHIRWPNESILFIHTISGDFFYTGIINGFHKGIAIIEEIGASSHQSLNDIEVTFQAFIYLHFKSRTVFLQEASTLFETDACRTIATFINGMARCLVAEEFNVYVIVQGIFQQIDYIAMIGDGTRTLFLHGFTCQLIGFCQIRSDMLHPSLVMACKDTRIIHFSNDSRSTGDFSSLRLGTTHASQA